MFEQAHGAEDCQEIFEFWWVENRFFSKNKSLGPTKGNRLAQRRAFLSDFVNTLSLRSLCFLDVKVTEK